MFFSLYNSNVEQHRSLRVCYAGRMPSTSVFSLEIAAHGVQGKKAQIHNFKRWISRRLQKLNLCTCPNNCDITAVAKVRHTAPCGSFSRNLLRAKLHETKGKRDPTTVTLCGLELPLQLIELYVILSISVTMIYS